MVCFRCDIQANLYKALSIQNDIFLIIIEGSICLCNFNIVFNVWEEAVYIGNFCLTLCKSGNNITKGKLIWIKNADISTWWLVERAGRLPVRSKYL